MPTTNNYDINCHPPKRSVKVRLRKEEEKRKRENDILNNMLRNGKIKLDLD